MNTLLLTLLIAFGIIIVCLALLGISLLLTGKSRLRIGMCGRIPSKKRDSGCGTDYSCSICGKGKDDKKED